MISGLNQEVDILGKTFHFQTELTGGGMGSARTEVFVGGKIVATRETSLGLEEGESEDEEAIRARMKEVHGKILSGFVDRAKRYQEREQEGSLPPVREPSGNVDTAEAVDSQTLAAVRVLVAQKKGLYNTDSAPPASPLITPPSPGAASESLRIRHLFGKFRRQIGADPAVDHGRVGDRLDRAAAGFEWMAGSPSFAEIRVDEQVRCNLLKEHVEEWVAGGRRADGAARIWSGILAFVGYLAEINDRSDLVSFDQQLLVWGIDTIQRHGVTAEILERFGDLYGRDPGLDVLLDEPEGVTAAIWTGHLRRVLTQM